MYSYFFSYAKPRNFWPLAQTIRLIMLNFHIFVSLGHNAFKNLEFNNIFLSIYRISCNVWLKIRISYAGRILKIWHSIRRASDVEYSTFDGRISDVKYSTIRLMADRMSKIRHSIGRGSDVEYSTFDGRPIECRKSDIWSASDRIGSDRMHTFNAELKTGYVHSSMRFIFGTCLFILNIIFKNLSDSFDS